MYTYLYKYTYKHLDIYIYRSLSVYIEMYRHIREYLQGTRRRRRKGPSYLNARGPGPGGSWLGLGVAGFQAVPATELTIIEPHTSPRYIVYGIQHLVYMAYVYYMVYSIWYVVYIVCDAWYMAGSAPFTLK